MKLGPARFRASIITLPSQALGYLDRNRNDLGAAALFLLLTLIVTYPLIVNLSSRIAACCDSWYFYWHIWWTKQALLGLRLDQFFTDHIFYPVGTSLSFESLYNSIIGIPLVSIFGGVLTFNLLFLSSYVLGAYGTYLLVVRLTGDRRAGVVAGVVFAFSAVRTQNLPFTNMSTIQWIPFLALWWLKTIDSPSARSALLSTLFFVLVVLSSGYYAISGSILILIIVERSTPQPRPCKGRSSLSRGIRCCDCSPCLSGPQGVVEQGLYPRQQSVRPCLLGRSSLVPAAVSF